MNQFNQKRHSQELLRLESVSVSYDGFKALDRVNLQVFNKEILFITGASGAGKTTLLNVLGGRIGPSQGRFVRKLPKDFFVSTVFQNLYLNEKQSLEKNLLKAYDSSIYDSSKDFAEDLLDFSKILGIHNRLHLKVKDANGGLKQKVAFLRAMLSRPDLIIADEPTASLDFENAKKMFEILNLYNVRQGLTVVWATHNRELIKKFSGRIAHLDQGKLIHSGHACFI